MLRLSTRAVALVFVSALACLYSAQGKLLVSLFTYKKLIYVKRSGSCDHAGCRLCGGPHARQWPALTLSVGTTLHTWQQ
jgi:hypothetical protein